MSRLIVDELQGLTSGEVIDLSDLGSYVTKTNTGTARSVVFDLAALTDPSTRSITMPDTNIDLGQIATNTGNITANTAELATKATIASVDLKADLDSPVFQGVPRCLDVAALDNDTSIANTRYVDTAVGVVNTELTTLETNVNYSAPAGLTPIGDFAGGAGFTITRIGNIVMLVVHNMNVTPVAGVVSSGAGQIPVGFRPASQFFQVFNATTDYISKIFIDSLGEVQLRTYDWTGADYSVAYATQAMQVSWYSPTA